MPRSTRTPVAPRDGVARAAWRSLPTAKLRAHLLAHPQLPDSVWTSESRLPGEKRAAFVARVLSPRRAVKAAA